jgi:hypothetical protein
MHRKVLGEESVPGFLWMTAYPAVQNVPSIRIAERGAEMARVRRNFYRRNSKKKAAPKSFKVTCAQCGKELLLEVPPLGKDLLCFDCYNKK